MYYGIQSGDIVTSMGGDKILSQRDYQNVLKQCTIGEEILMKIMRKVKDGIFRDGNHSQTDTTEITQDSKDTEHR